MCAVSLGAPTGGFASPTFPCSFRRAGYVSYDGIDNSIRLLPSPRSIVSTMLTLVPQQSFILLLMACFVLQLWALADALSVSLEAPEDFDPGHWCVLLLLERVVKRWTPGPLVLQHSASIQERTVEQTVDAPTLQIQEQIVKVIPLIPQEDISKRILEQIVEAPVPQIEEQIVEVVKSGFSDELRELEYIEKIDGFTSRPEYSARSICRVRVFLLSAR